jgi:hypothetical protein
MLNFGYTVFPEREAKLMKQCPNCKTDYTDDSLQFCLNDGTKLIYEPEAAETVRMSFAADPVRVSMPPDSVPTVYAHQPISQNQPAKKGFGLIIAGILGFFLLLVIAGIAAFILFRQSGNKNTIAAVSPSPTISQTPMPNDETARLKEEMANLKKQIENQKNQKPNSPAENIPPSNRKETTTARANSPDDGFLALRSEPNSETGHRITKIPHGATLSVLGCPKPSNIGKMAGRWCQVIYNGQSGWAFDAFMTF